MTYFPHNPFRRSAASAANPPVAVRQKFSRDILWNQPVFKAPALSNPRIAFEPLPFTANRLTQARRRA
ncbi:MAG TPA: hypothetical protein VIM71_01770 [Lacunisphaera sp.]